MKMLLMKDGQASAKLDIRICSVAFDVISAEAVDPGLLPPGIWIPMQAGGMPLAEAASHWLHGRQMPDYREDLDELLIRAYQLEAYRMGRMYHTQHTAALLSYYVSGYDRYYLTPEREETVCYALEDHHFMTMFRFPPCTERMADQIRHKEAAAMMPGMFGASPDYAIPSGCPSWWEMGGDKKVLAQKPGLKAMRAYKEAIQPRFPSAHEGGIVRTDFSWLDGDVLWLSDLIPCLKPGRDGAWKQAEDLLAGIRGSHRALGMLRECEAAAEACGGMVAWSEMGICCREGGAEPVVIL